MAFGFGESRLDGSGLGEGIFPFFFQNKVQDWLYYFTGEMVFITSTITF